ncbi:MAG: 6-phosphofructokinase [Bacteroidota bacterium]
MKKINKIAVMTSGGDAPGMNANIRAVVRSGIYNGLEVYGIENGFEGLIDNQIKLMDHSSVSNIIQRGGTILKTSRSKRFFEKSYRQQAFENLKTLGIEGLVVCGGNGSYTGAKILNEEFGIVVVGTPGTIDNDLYGTDFTIGYDTALNTVIEAVDKIRDTASSHNRMFFIEVMGRDAGFIALNSGIASGAEAIFIPEQTNDYESFVERFEKNQRDTKLFSIIIIAEGDESGGAFKVAEMFKEKYPDLETRVSILGHIQRGGNPSCRDRVLASKLGAGAIDALLQGKTNIAIGEINGKITYTPFEKAIKLQQNSISKEMLQLAKVLSL